MIQGTYKCSMEGSLKNALILEPFDRFKKFKKLNWLELNFLLIRHTVRFKWSTRERDQRDKIAKNRFAGTTFLSPPMIKDSQIPAWYGLKYRLNFFEEILETPFPQNSSIFLETPKHFIKTTLKHS